MRKRNSQIVTLPVLLALMFVQGCKNTGQIKPGNDPVVVRAEQALTIAPELFQLVVTLEAEHRDYLLTVNPGIHSFAEKLRRKVVSPTDGTRIPQSKFWLQTTVNLLDAYKDNRNAENRATLMTYLKLVESGVRQAQNYLPTIQAVKS